jgi:hypothetical protein
LDSLKGDPHELNRTARGGIGHILLKDWTHITEINNSYGLNPRTLNHALTLALIRLGVDDKRPPMRDAYGYIQAQPTLGNCMQIVLDSGKARDLFFVARK